MSLRLFSRALPKSCPASPQRSIVGLRVRFNSSDAPVTPEKMPIPTRTRNLADFSMANRVRPFHPSFPPLRLTVFLRFAWSPEAQEVSGSSFAKLSFNPVAQTSLSLISRRRKLLLPARNSLNSHAVSQPSFSLWHSQNLIRCEVDSTMEPTDYRVMGLGCDVSSELSVQQAFRKVMDTYGRIDSVVASAGALLFFHLGI